MTGYVVIYLSLLFAYKISGLIYYAATLLLAYVTKSDSRFNGFKACPILDPQAAVNRHGTC